VRPTGGECFILAHNGRHTQERRDNLRVEGDHSTDSHLESILL
jgi:hypothetical protein